MEPHAGAPLRSRRKTLEYSHGVQAHLPRVHSSPDAVRQVGSFHSLAVSPDVGIAASSHLMSATMCSFAVSVPPVLASLEVRVGLVGGRVGSSRAAFP